MIATATDRIGSLTDAQAESLVAAPGWIICERLSGASEVRTEGGLIMPQDPNRNAALMVWGRVLSCGQFYEARSGGYRPWCAEEINQAQLDWPLPKGTVILWHPHNPWEIPGFAGKHIVAIKSIDVIGVLPESR